MIQNFNERGVSRGDSVTIQPHPGASTEDLIDHIKPAIGKNSDLTDVCQY